MLNIILFAGMVLPNEFSPWADSMTYSFISCTKSIVIKKK